MDEPRAATSACKTATRINHRVQQNSEQPNGVAWHADALHMTLALRASIGVHTRHVRLQVGTHALSRSGNVNNARAESGDTPPENVQYNSVGLSRTKDDESHERDIDGTLDLSVLCGTTPMSDAKLA